MADILPAGDNTARPLEPTAASPFEASSQQLSNPDAASHKGHAAISLKTNEMISSSILPGVDLIADGAPNGSGTQVSDTAHSSAQHLKAGAREVEKDLKKDLPAEEMARAINHSLEQGVPLDKLVDQINKDMPYPPGINFRHAVLETDQSGKQELVLGMGPFAGPQFKVDGAHVTVDYPQK